MKLWEIAQGLWALNFLSSKSKLLQSASQSHKQGNIQSQAFSTHIKMYIIAERMGHI